MRARTYMHQDIHQLITVIKALCTRHMQGQSRHYLLSKFCYCEKIQEKKFTKMFIMLN